MGERGSFRERVTVDPEVVERFGDLHPPFDRQAAVPEANRCLYCFDAPCTIACPTHIDVPRFIKKIASGNLAGSARTILDANILGASCARACPVEVLCEGACVMHRYNKQPIQIARLQRFAMDSLQESGAPLPFEPGAETGLSVALIGAGPASLACAAELRRRGIRAHLYDAADQQRARDEGMDQLTFLQRDFLGVGGADDRAHARAGRDFDSGYARLSSRS